jgi:hypothetical protein
MIILKVALRAGARGNALLATVLASLALGGRDVLKMVKAAG